MTVPALIQALVYSIGKSVYSFTILKVFCENNTVGVKLMCEVLSFTLFSGVQSPKRLNNCNCCNCQYKKTCFGLIKMDVLFFNTTKWNSNIILNKEFWILIQSQKWHIYLIHGTQVVKVYYTFPLRTLYIWQKCSLTLILFLIVFCTTLTD